jgi:hypothetical protein
VQTDVTRSVRLAAPRTQSIRGVVADGGPGAATTDHHERVDPSAVVGQSISVDP